MKALRAACSANEGPGELPLGTGGGGVDRAGGRGAEPGGGGGAEAGVEGEDCAILPEGFRDDGGGTGGFFPIGGAGLGFEDILLAEEKDAREDGRRLPRSCETEGMLGADELGSGGGAEPGTLGADGGLGAIPRGGRGAARDDSGSERYGE